MSAPTITIHQPETVPSVSNRFCALIPRQLIAIVSEFTLESGVVLRDVPVAFKTWGKLNETKDNAMVICHALTGSSDVEDWWGPLLGSSHAFDPSRFFIFCANVLGSPYGTASPVTRNPNRVDGGCWGPEFPATVVRDDVRLQKLLLDHFQVASIAVVIGGSMGGMATLEWPLTSPLNYVRNIVPIATCARHSAWGISWGEAQRQSIWSDPAYAEGWYQEGQAPDRGLAAARMAALLTYRSRDSFESRFGRKEVDSEGEGSGKEDSSKKGGFRKSSLVVGWGTPRTQAERDQAAHNDGNRVRISSSSNVSSTSTSATPKLDSSRPISPTLPSAPSSLSSSTVLAPINGEKDSSPTIFSAQSYLRYQGDKFVSRFDANCYIHLSRKMDSHDVGRNRPYSPHPLSLAPAGSLVIAISSDGLFTLSDQKELADILPEAQLLIVDSPDGHDGFLTSAEFIDAQLLIHLRKQLPEIYSVDPLLPKVVYPTKEEPLIPADERDW